MLKSYCSLSIQLTNFSFANLSLAVFKSYHSVKLAINDCIEDYIFCRWCLERIFTNLVLRFTCVLTYCVMYHDKGKFRDENFTDSKVIVKSVIIPACINYHVYSEAQAKVVHLNVCLF